MSYFENQLRARRRTAVILLLYVLILAAAVLAIDIVLGLMWRYGFPEIYGARVPGALYVWGAIATLALIGGITLRHIVRLREGGESVARLLGAQRVLPEARDTLGRRLVNVAEEMAIASGTPVPALYLMDDEPGINALMASSNNSSPALVLTRGALHTLNRDELQGVIGHEFSHIVQGEASLNLRTIALLAGLCGVPYAGRLCARLIKAGFTRGQEFAADAASVRFTGNPIGIAGALDQIRACAAGALVKNRYAEHLSHMFFDESQKSFLPALFASHPPLETRIRGVLPNFAAADYRARRVSATAEAPAAPARPTLAEGKRAGDLAHRWWRTPEESLGLIGSLPAGKVEYVRRLLETLPADLREALRRKDSSPSVTLALMLAAHPEVMQQQLAAARVSGAGALAEAAAALAPKVAQLSPELRLPAIELALPTLKLARAEARRALLPVLEAVIHADRRASLQAFIILGWLRIALGPLKRHLLSRSLRQLRAEALLVLSLLAHVASTRAGAADEMEAAFRAGATTMQFSDATLAPRDALSAERCSAALERLRRLDWRAKEQFMRGLFASVAADGKVHMSEAQLIRVIGACLSCPMPPLLEAL